MPSRQAIPAARSIFETVMSCFRNGGVKIQERIANGFERQDGALGIHYA
jgi:hypothetical protein